MHMLRVFGNNDVHYNPGMKTSYKTTATDLVLNLISIERILDFGLEHSKT